MRGKGKETVIISYRNIDKLKEYLQHLITIPETLMRLWRRLTMLDFINTQAAVPSHHSVHNPYFNKVGEWLKDSWCTVGMLKLNKSVG